MTADGWLTLAVLLGVLLALARELAPPPFVILGAVVTLLLLDVITATEALSGFANPAPFTVAALYIVARAVQRTGAVSVALGTLLPSDGTGSLRSLLLRLLAPTAATSALLNNTPIVAMLAPGVARWGEARGLSGSKLLIPLSYAAIVGGVATAIGTSTTLVVSGLLEADGQAPLGLFEPSRLGVPVAIVSVLAIVLLAPRLMPERQAAGRAFREGVREFTLSLRVMPDGPVADRSLADAGLRALQGVYCVSIRRDDRVISPVEPDELLRGGDELTFVGDVDQVVDLQQRRGLVSTEAHHAAEIAGPGERLFEAVIGPSSVLVGSTLKRVGFRGRFGAAVLAIHRSGELLHDKLGEVELRVGDTLLCLARPGFVERSRGTGDFVVVASASPDAPLDPRRTRITGVVVALLLLTAGTGLLPILEASLLAAICLVGTRVMSANDAQRAVDLPVIVVIAGAFGLGRAVERSGLAEVIADGVLTATSAAGTWGLVLGIVLLVIVLTELITNNAAAVLVYPIAVAAASSSGLDSRSLAIAVAVAASLSFVTPIGYQTNLMVYGLGNYRFTDFARLGVPLSLLNLILVSWLTVMVV